jgi:miniconductance mechanosensitive channel
MANETNITPPAEESVSTVYKVVEATEAITEQTKGWAESLSNWLSGFGMSAWASRMATASLLLIALILVCVVIYVIVRPLLLKMFKLIVKRTKFDWDNQLFGHGVFRWLTHLVPAILIYTVTPGLFDQTPKLVTFLKAASLIYIIISILFVFDSLLNALHASYASTELAARFPMRSLMQVLKLIAILVAFVLGIAVILGQSPLALLGGLGVFASVLMLVFKDPILGFVAGIQLSANRMVLPGDWIEMPSHNADGDVLEVGLTTVKVQNWDKTITTLPPYALITESFKNWRGMQEAGARRIKRSLFIDLNSIRLCNAEIMDKFAKVKFIAKHLEDRQNEIEEWNSTREFDNSVAVNGRHLTNIGTFRSYVLAYLKNHPKIHQNMTLLVRQLQPTGRGLPLEIYCFTNTTAWAEYEDIQSDIFDHLLAVAHEFELRIFQEPSGLDFVK